MHVKSSTVRVTMAASAALAAQAMVAVPPADAATSWEPTVVLDRHPAGASVAMARRGGVVAAWGNESGAIMVARRPAGGTWSEPRVIGRSNTAVGSPEVATDARGDVTVVWVMHRRGFTDGVMAARLSVGHGWSDPVRLSEDRQVPGYPQDGKGAWGADDVDLAVSPRGAVSVAWDWGSEERHKAWRIQSVYQSPRHGWSRVAHVTRATGAQQPQVGIAGDGTVTLAYGHQSPGHHQHLLARRLRPGRAWSRADVVTRRGYDPKLQVDRAGDALLVYTPNSSRIMAAYRGPGGRWKEPRRLTPVGVRTDGFFDLAMNGRGAALVAWERGGRIDLVRRPPQGPWSAPVRVVEGSELSSEVVVALNGAGDTFLAWGMYALHGCYRAHDGTWSNPVTLSPDAAVDVLESVRAGVTPDGHAVLMWTQEARGLKVRIGSTS